MKCCPEPYQDYEYDEKLSFKDFTGRTFKEVDFSKKVIYGSVFSNETPDTHVFPDDTNGTTFIDCMLDNVFIPDGNAVIGGSQKRFKVQNDGNDWLIDEDGNPTKPIGHEIFTKFNLPVPDPADIPAQKVSEHIDLMEEARKK